MNTGMVKKRLEQLEAEVRRLRHRYEREEYQDAELCEMMFLTPHPRKTGGQSVKVPADARAICDLNGRVTFTRVTGWEYE